MVLWTEHFRQQFIWPTAAVGLPLMCASELMQVGTSHLSEMKMDKVIGFLKSCFHP